MMRADDGRRYEAILQRLIDEAKASGSGLTIGDLIPVALSRLRYVTTNPERDVREIDDAMKMGRKP